MDLLPTSHTEFSNPDYWDNFFKKRGKIPFEWYGEYPQLQFVLHKYISPSNIVLVVGCGNSALSETMYDNGLQKLVNIDISDTVIRQMSERNKQKRPNMVFEKVDVTQMGYPDGHFHVALDKGTLDALLVSEEMEFVSKVHLMFAQIVRCLKFGGRYILVSLLQDHVQRVLLEYFTNLGWPIRIHKIQSQEDSVKHSALSMPVFAVVITKLKSSPNIHQIVEVCRFEDQIDRLEDIKYLSAIIKDMQYYHIVRQQLSKHLPGDQQVSLELHSRESLTPRYNLTVVDAPTQMSSKFAIFIVPQGRETEWLFSTDKGRLHLQESAGFQRLVVVTLNRGHEYENIDAIKAELSNKVMELAPLDCPPKAQIPFLSIGEDLGKRYPVAQGHSDISGDYLVEDVEINGKQVFRRLVFMANKNVVQSEARMLSANMKKKRRHKAQDEGQPGNMKVDKGYLSSDYLIAMVGGLGFLQSLDQPLIGVLIGLGGGAFPSFVHQVYPEISLDCVELDPTVADVAQTWFELTLDARLRVHIADGSQFLRELSTQGEKRDVIFVDVDSKDHSVGLSCPPLAFVEVDFLQTISSLLSDTGVFVLNLASRDESIKTDILNRIQSIFTSCACLHLEEDINTIVYATNRTLDDPFLDLENLNSAFHKMDSKVKSTWRTSNVEIADMMSALKFLE
ncbi:methyltransferase-like protein 13 [Biomphalaria glabrata]|uniref:Methyltransferase domain-containing protein n=1 Tax=Biomphalaria glabrata TaxID=6526 RepID=A0A2C9JFW1_BIOGL|nr:methyltransferase-like protein 13 [Biomphalaria glabrata]KAI8779458.1 methyltransferase protein 13 [Biomphalaria glabrata]